MQRRPLRIFLSYAREDRQTVESIYKRLKKEGFKPWMDTEDLIGGEDWVSGIKKAIQNSDVFLVFLSAATTNRRGILQTEIRQSLSIARDILKNTIYLIPVKLDDSPIPDDLEQLQYIKFSSRDSWKMILSALNSTEAQVFGKVLSKTPQKKIEKNENHLISNRDTVLEPILRGDKRLSKQRIFIAMPFSDEMEDTFYYGIQRAIDASGYHCYRSDKNAFVGDILQEIKVQLGKSVAVVADLTNANPNVYLEVGYAWGNNKPTILIMKQGDKPRFDVQGQKCLMYKSIKHLEEILTKELLELKENGAIH